jgi:GDPmannose 4,6-dehydratase
LNLREAGASVRFLQASSAEIFGDPAASPQTEDTLIVPVTPYGAAKAFAHPMIGVYRRGLFATTAILYNRESPAPTTWRRWSRFSRPTTPRTP